MKIEQVMTKDVASCGPNDSLNEAARIMWERDCGVVPVVEAGPERRVVGIVTDRDVAMAAYTRGKRLGEVPTKDAMTSPVQTCRPDDDVAQAEERMREAQVHRLPVVDDAQQLLGIVSLADLARRAQTKKGSRRPPVTSNEIGETLNAISQPRLRASGSA